MLFPNILYTTYNIRHTNLMISIEQVRELRDKTGISVMQCKKALEEAGGDEEKALVLLREKGAEISAKKQGRTLGSGVIEAYVHAGSKIGVMVELLCETDFVAKNEDFKLLAMDIAMHIAAMNSEAGESGPLLEEPFVKDPSRSIKDLIEQATQKFGENIKIGRFTRYALLE